MGMTAEVFGIGRFEWFNTFNLLDYAEHFYDDGSDDTVVICTVAQSWCSKDSLTLAKVVGVVPDDVTTHAHLGPLLPSDLGIADNAPIGDSTARKVYDDVLGLLIEGAKLYFRPNM